MPTSGALPDLFLDMPYTAHIASWGIFNRVRNFFINLLLRIFLGQNGLQIAPQSYAYTGDLIGMMLALGAAGYVMVKAVD